MSSQIAAIGPALRALREDRSLRQNLTAERAGITKAMLSAYDNGKRRPSLKTLDQILGALDADLSDLARAMASSSSGDSSTGRGGVPRLGRLI